MGKGKWGMDDREEIIIEEFKTSRKNIKNDGGEKMKKDYKHLFYKEKYYTEKEILKKYFNRNI